MRNTITPCYGVSARMDLTSSLKSLDSSLGGKSDELGARIPEDDFYEDPEAMASMALTDNINQGSFMIPGAVGVYGGTKSHFVTL